MKRVKGVAPSSPRWQRDALLLSYTRMMIEMGMEGFAPPQTQRVKLPLSS